MYAFCTLRVTNCYCVAKGRRVPKRRSVAATPCQAPPHATSPTAAVGRGVAGIGQYNVSVTYNMQFEREI